MRAWRLPLFRANVLVQVTEDKTSFLLKSKISSGPFQLTVPVHLTQPCPRLSGDHRPCVLGHHCSVTAASPASCLVPTASSQLCIQLLCCRPWRATLATSAPLTAKSADGSWARPRCPTAYTTLALRAPCATTVPVCPALPACFPGNLGVVSLCCRHPPYPINLLKAIDPLALFFHHYSRVGLSAPSRPFSGVALCSR